MIYAVPCNESTIAGHYSKANRFLIVDDDKTQSFFITNPAVSISGCKGKKQLVELLIKHRVDSVVIRNIGERLLSKLFNHNISVYKAKPRSELMSIHPSQLDPVTDLSSARPSSNHKISCCHSEQKNHQQHRQSKLSPKTVNSLRQVLRIHLEGSEK